ncbi:MAG: hypothetical protein IJ405_07790, partial [Lachnospiraceae bacterium]|nr:hypothetical protein [Lachnospiraceae bacterium]
ILMAVEGYGESGYEAAARGLSPDAIQMLGINSAMSNVLTDKILLRACRGQHGFVRSVTEGSVGAAYEWLLTDTVDNWVSGDLSREDTYYCAALAEGQTPEEAKATICEIRKQELLQAMAVGGTMSGMAWGGGRAADYLINRINPGPVSPDTPESVNPLQEEGISEILEVGNSGDGTDGVPSEGGTSSWVRNLDNTSDLNVDDFLSLKDNGVVKVNTSGSDRPLTGAPNSYYKTGNGEHIFVYDGDGKLIYDISSSRVKGFKINVDPNGIEHYQAYKLEGAVPDAIKKLFGW